MSKQKELLLALACVLVLVGCYHNSNDSLTAEAQISSNIIVYDITDTPDKSSNIDPAFAISGLDTDGIVDPGILAPTPESFQDVNINIPLNSDTQDGIIQKNIQSSNSDANKSEVIVVPID